MSGQAHDFGHERRSGLGFQLLELDLAGFHLLDQVSSEHLERIRKRKPLPVADLIPSGGEPALHWVRIEPTGAMTLTFQLPLQSGFPSLTYTPTLSAGRVAWACAGEEIKTKYLPPECQGQ